jgi:hypothetical protein
VYTGLWWGDLRGRYHLEEAGLDGSVMVKWVFKKWNGSVDWFDMAEGRDRWRTL